MNAIWKGANILAICCVLLVRHISAQTEHNGTVIRKFESEKATIIWPVTEKTSKLEIFDDSGIIIRFISGYASFPPNRDPRVVPADDGNANYGFTLHNVSLSDAGEYRCQFDGKPCGRTILYVWGRPEKGRVIPEGDLLRCEVQVTSLPAAHRPPVANMVSRWTRRDRLPPDGRINNTVPENVTLLPIAESYINPGHADNGSDYSCVGREEGSRLWSDSSEWYQYVFYGPGPAVPVPDGSSASPNVTDTGIDKVLDIDLGSPEFLIIVSLVSLVAVLLLGVIIAVAILCRRKKSTEGQQNATDNHQMAAKGHEQYSDEEDSTVLVDNTEYSDTNCFGSDSGLGEYSDIREIERLRIKGRGPAPLPKNENIYELQESVQVSDEHKAKLDNKDDEDEEIIVTDIYAVPMKKGTLK